MGIVQHVESESDDSGKPGQRGTLAVLQRKGSDDASLVGRISAGDSHAVAELFDRYAYVLRGVFVRTLGSTVDVEDLMQEAFFVVVRRCSTLRDPGALRSFVVSVAIRIARNELRKRAFRRFLGLDDLVEPPVTPPHDAEAAQGVRRLYEALSKLDSDTRIAFVVRHIEGYELTEAAEICKCSLATLKRRLAKADKCFEALSRSDPVLRGLLEEGRKGT